MVNALDGTDFGANFFLLLLRREENPEKKPMSASSLEGLLLEVTKPPPGSRQNASKAASGTQSAIRPTKEDIN